ncbi:MAG: cupredoxin domain-containing protein [candidate division SR1 bacterium]|nr:cupredoxin domain-containing protein [candidate division SR1 bacterium]
MSKKNNSNSGRMIVAGILILGGIFYAVSSGNLFSQRKNNTSGFCPMTNNGNVGGACGGGKTTTISTNTTSPVTTTYETIQVGENGTTTVPETINLSAGKSYKIVITPTSDGLGCRYSLTIPSIDNNTYPIKKGQAITITVNNIPAGNYNIVCGAMGMHIGYIVVQ